MSQTKLPPPNPNPRMIDHIFVSYSSKDRAFVDQLAHELRQLGHLVWVDFEGIHGGEKWRQSIADALHPSRVVLLVLSPDSIQSEWVEEEIRTAQSLDKDIIPLLLRPLPDDIPSEIIKGVTSDIHYRNFTGGFQAPFEQLLTDLPKPKAGLAGYCDRLIAKLAEAPWGLDHYIQERARLLPIHASPYDEGLRQTTSENLLQTLWANKRTIVLGEPGMGKSVALERLAWELASNDPPIVPLIINLREYDGKPLLEWVRRTLYASGEASLRAMLTSAQATEKFLHEMPFDFYFLLDGLNEVRPDARQTVLDEIRTLGMLYSDYPIVVTSRIQDESWRDLRSSSFDAQTVVVQTIAEDQAEAYLHAHLEDGADLWRRLDPRMRGLVTTPLLLWLVKEAWLETQQRIPGNRGELYASFIKRMLRRDDERRINHHISTDARLKALETLAFTMHQRQIIAMERPEALTILGDAMLNALLVNGLLQGEDIIRFAPHQTIQEHFAARALQDDVEKAMHQAKPNVFMRLFTKPEATPLDWASEAWWAETFIQLAGITSDANRLAQAIAERNPWLAWWCVQEGRDVDPETERIIQAQSALLVESDRVQDRRNAVQALLKLPRARVIDPLAKLALDVGESVSEPAREALRDLGQSGTVAMSNAGYQFGMSFKGRKNSDWRPVIMRLGDIVTDTPIPDMEMCLVPVGSFKMGEGKNAHPQTINQPYWIARYPVTNAQWQRAVEAGAVQKPHDIKWYDDRNMQDAPVVYVDWFMSHQFAQWTRCALPSEMHWEYASRGVESWVYPWGNDFVSGNLIYEKTPQYGDKMPAPVTMLPQGASWIGAMHMSGNVWEWTTSEYKAYPYDAKDGRERDTAKSTDVRRVLRGGAFYSLTNNARGASRGHSNPSSWVVNRGFRVLCAPKGRIM